MFLSLKKNQDKLATALGMGSAIAATVGAIGVAAMFSPAIVTAAVGTLVAAVIATDATSSKSRV